EAEETVQISVSPGSTRHPFAFPGPDQVRGRDRWQPRRSFRKPHLTPRSSPMTAQKGKDLLLKLDDGSGAFVSVAGLRTRRLTFNAETVDVTDAESGGQWRELLAGAGVRRASLNGTGLFKDAASDELVRGVFFSGEIRD